MFESSLLLFSIYLIVKADSGGPALDVFNKITYNKITKTTKRPEAV